MGTNKLSLAVAALAIVVLSSGCARFKSFGYSGFGRDGWQQPDEVVDSLEVRAGDRIADLGAGGGLLHVPTREGNRAGRKGLCG